LEDGTKQYNIDGAEVFDFSIEISSDYGTDVGGLKAMVLARGDHRADYTDVAENYDDISQSVIMNIQAEFDQLVHNVATKINEVLADAAGVKQGTLTDVTYEDGTTAKVLENAKYAVVDDDGYLRAEDGSPLQLFTKSSTAGYQKVTATDEDGNTAEYWLYNEEVSDEKDSLYSVRNIELNPELMQNPSSLGFRLPDGSEDTETMEALKAVFTEETYSLNPNVLKQSSLIEYYNDLVSQVANSGYVYNSIYTNQANTVESIQSAREQIVGVSSDEELTNMIKYQNAYNAASRYINVINEMLEHIISTLAT
jgi:flagellar hook-associated protein 1 FlgK